MREEDEADILWYTEEFTEGLKYLYRVKTVYYTGTTSLQKVDILELDVFEKTLFLDNKIQSSWLDEYIYHEALVHPAMLSHPNPSDVIIAGGGEGATLREVLKHKTVENVMMVDIDGELVELCKRYLPEWSEGSFEDERTNFIIDDARKVVEGTNNQFDVIISDLTEPLEGGPSALLFTREFYQRVYSALRDDGILALQAGSAGPIYNDFILSLLKTLKDIFPFVSGYSVFIMSFSMLWGFVVASKRYEPVNIDLDELWGRYKARGLNCRFYSPLTHRHMFFLPPYITTNLDKGRVLTDEKPFIWTA